MPDEELIERFDMVAHSLHRRTYWYQIAIIIIFVLLIAASYLFVLQPYYQPAETEMVADSYVSESGDMTGYVIKHSDGSYTFVDSDGLSRPIQSENVELLISTGIEVKEEKP